MKTGRGPKAITSAKSIREAERRAEIIQMRLDGRSLQEIGDHMGITAVSVHNVITRALASMAKEPAEELLGLELARLDSLYAEAMNVLRSFTPLLHNGKVVQIPVINRDGEIVKDPGTGQPLTCIAEDKAARLAAIAAAVRVMERRSRLLGLDAPSRMQADFNVTTDEKPARDFSKLDSNEMQLLGVLLDKLDDPNTPAPDERRDLRHEVREKLTPFEIGVLQSVFRKLDIRYIAEDTVSGLYSTTSLPAQ
ncbi:MAG: sigma factor-like helix-turn-helix DNA-binding protein [Pseudomonadota bacterium]